MIQQSLFPQKAENASFPRYPVKAPAVKNGRNSPFLLHKDKKDNSLRPTGSGADKIRHPGQYLDSHENQGRTTPGKGLEQAVRHVSPRLYSLKLHACR